jgi:hypothetical protein
MRSSRLRSLVVGLVALTVVLTVSAVAQGWVRPAADAISTSDGGVYRACRDGITFQIANNGGGTRRWEVQAQPGSTVIAQGEATLEALIPPEVLEDGATETHVATITVRWAGGRLLDPGPGAVKIGVYELTSPHFGDPDVVEDCFIFPPVNNGQCKKDGWRRWGFKNRGRCIAYVEHRAREACVAEREAGEAEFRAKYGTGNQGRHALRNCVRETT